jgi:hypothetical protein
MMTLTELIDSEPLSAGRTDQQVMDWLNETVIVENPIDFIELWEWATDETTAFWKIFDERQLILAGTSALTNSQKGDTLAIWSLLNSGGDWQLDLSKGGVRGPFNTIAGGVVISNPDKGALFARSDMNVLRWTQASDLRASPTIATITGARA